MRATIVFEKNWNAINERNEDGSNKYRYIINKGSSRSSKTVSLIQLYDAYCRSFESKRCTVWRDTKTDCKKTVLVDTLKYLKANYLYKNGQDFNKTESIFTYDTDSTVEIHGTDDEETVHGLTQDMAWMNEPYKISKDTFDQIDQRTSDFVFIDYNPKKGHWVEDLMKDERALVIHSTFKDNPFCPAEQRNKILSYQPISLCDIVTLGLLQENDAREYNCEKNDLKFSDKQINELLRCKINEEKNSASAFKWQVYGLGEKAEQPNRIFNWKPIPLSDYQAINVPIYIGVDWGKVDPWGIIEAKYLDGNLYLKELNYLSEDEWRLRMNSTEQMQTSADEGIITWMFNRLNISKSVPILCDTNRPLKIHALRGLGYQAYPANKPKGSIIDGIDILQNLNVYYTSESKNIEHEQENYSRQVDRYGIVLEEPIDADNHCIDPSRYVCLYLKILGIIKAL